LIKEILNNEVVPWRALQIEGKAVSYGAALIKLISESKISGKV